MTRLNPYAVIVVLACMAAANAVAHPSVGVVIAPNGDVFYSDLEKVWRIAPNGARQVVVPGVHAHELAVDASGAIYGEDSKWLGGDRYQHRIWKRSPNGKISDVVPWRDGFGPDYGLTRDAAGTMYWVDCNAARVCTVRKRDRSGRTSNAVTEGKFKTRINWIAATPAGEVYVIDGPDLRKIDGRGRLVNVARVSTRADGRHALMGVSLDRGGNVYLAAHWDGAIIRVSPAGALQVVARSPAPWLPSGVAISPRGDLWILEWSGSNARVRRALQKE